MMNTKTNSPNKKFCSRATHTYKEWSEHGYYVMIGQKATGRDPSGVATFTPSQVKRKQPPRIGWYRPPSKVWYVDTYRKPYQNGYRQRGYQPMSQAASSLYSALLGPIF